jgi:hypothetical protein
MKKNMPHKSPRLSKKKITWLIVGTVIAVLATSYVIHIQIAQYSDRQRFAEADEKNTYGERLSRVFR